MTTPVYLRPDVYFEPLFNKWFMWPYLMAPAPAAMNLANHHLRLMKSFVVNARIHARAAKNKALVGGSLVNIPVEKVDEVSALLDGTTTRYGDLIEFSAAVAALDELLRTEAKGMSLEPLYERIPPLLRGLVELQYDLNNQPSFRFIEGLLYHTRFYKPEAQSVCLGTLHSAQRAFVLSTPRLADENHLHVDVPFNHPFVDMLFRMREQPRELAHVKELMSGLHIEGGVEFDSLFTIQPPPKPEPFEAEGAQVRYLGHAGLMVRTRSTTVLIDPVIAYRNDEHTGKTTFADLPPHIDYVLVTHTHMDHVCLETLIQLKHKIGVVLVPKNNSGLLADPSIKLMLKALGFATVIEMEDMESVAFPEGYLMAVPFLGEHADLAIRSKTAWLVEACGRRILAAADSSNIDPQLYPTVHALIGDLDVLFVGMECKGGPLRWLYGPLLTRSITREQNESRRFNGADFKAAACMARAFNAAQVFVYALGAEPWFRYFMGLEYDKDNVQLAEAQRLVDDCHARGIASKRLSGLEVISLAPKASGVRKAMF
jgi:L-ascorbate metabolism protein UlaG (beta-lactamase superfamily)